MDHDIIIPAADDSGRVVVLKDGKRVVEHRVLAWLIKSDITHVIHGDSAIPITAFGAVLVDRFVLQNPDGSWGWSSRTRRHAIAHELLCKSEIEMEEAELNGLVVIEGKKHVMG